MRVCRHYSAASCPAAVPAVPAAPRLFTTGARRGPRREVRGYCSEQFPRLVSPRTFSCKTGAGGPETRENLLHNFAVETEPCGRQRRLRHRTRKLGGCKPQLGCARGPSPPSHLRSLIRENLDGSWAWQGAWLSAPLGLRCVSTFLQGLTPANTRLTGEAGCQRPSLGEWGWQQLFWHCPGGRDKPEILPASSIGAVRFSVLRRVSRSRGLQAASR